MTNQNTWSETNQNLFMRDPDAEPAKVEVVKTHEQICKRRELEDLIYMKQLKEDGLLGEFEE